MPDAGHWNRFYDRAEESLGWYQPETATLNVVVSHSTASDSVIDVGGGTGRLAGPLLDRGYHDLTILDLSPLALEQSRAMLGDRADRVTWIEGDITAFTPTRRWDLWHDRALFHFLVDPTMRDDYRRRAVDAISPGGRLVVATFGPDAPDQCARLPVQRYSADELVAAFAPDFEVIAQAELPPTGSVGDQRPYVVAVLTPSSSARSVRSCLAVPR